MTVDRDFPSFYAVLRWFPTFRAAWTAAGVVVDRSHEEWTEIEEWYLRESIGILSRKQIAEDLRRSADAVHRRLYDLGYNTRNHWGWTTNRAALALSLHDSVLRIHIKRGNLPCFLGNWFIYVDPADLIGLEGIDWRRASKDIKVAARKSLMHRAVKILAGIDWRAESIYRLHPNYRLRPAQRPFPNPTPKPIDIRIGNRVEVVDTLSGRDVAIGRRGKVLSVEYRAASRTGVVCWRARVEFKKQRPHGNPTPTVTYSIPLQYLRKLGRGKA
jgi:hypothetical protein